MKKISKKQIREMLRQDYMTALSFFASLLADVEEDALYSAIEDLDDMVWPVACEDTRYQDVLLRIYSGLRMAA